MGPLPSRGSKVLGCPPCQQPAWLGSALSSRRKAQQTLSRGLPRTPRRGAARTRPGTEGDILMGGERDQRHHVSRTRMLSGGESPFIGSSWAASDTAVSFQTRQGPGAEAHPEIPGGELDRQTVHEGRLKGSHAGRGNTLQVTTVCTAAEEASGRGCGFCTEELSPLIPSSAAKPSWKPEAPKTCPTG